jgi:signal transduction histidine kinase
MVETAAIRGPIEEELDRRLFHLKTLYDMSCSLFGMLEIKAVLRKFLLMTTGNFGVLEGFVIQTEGPSEEITEFVFLGFPEDDKPQLLQDVKDMMAGCSEQGRVFDRSEFGELGIPSGLIACVVPFTVDERCRGLLGLGEKITGEPYSLEDKDLLVTLGNNLVIALRNARYAAELRNAYEEVSSLNRAKDKVIHHLSHELKTPLSLIKASLTLLERKLAAGYPEGSWEKTLRRAAKNVDRLMTMQEEVEDIMLGRDVRIYSTINLLLDQCTDQLGVLAAEELGDDAVVERIRESIEKLFGPKEQPPAEVLLDKFVAEHLDALIPLFPHRQVTFRKQLDSVPSVSIPPDVLTKVINGLVKNAVENTPDGGMIDLGVKSAGDGEVHLVVRDYGVGITDGHRKRIFEGFFPTQETDAYCSAHPFDFNAGGKGADLLRMKIFSERFNFRLHMESERCKYIPDDNDVCVGSVALCRHCTGGDDCAGSGGTEFKVVFFARGVEKS